MPRRLARRPDAQAGEQVGQRRMVLPVGDQAAQQIGAAEKRAVGRRRSADHDDVVAAAGTGVPAVEHELLSAESGFVRVLVGPVVISASSATRSPGEC